MQILYDAEKWIVGGSEVKIMHIAISYAIFTISTAFVGGLGPGKEKLFAKSNKLNWGAKVVQD